VNTVEVSFVHMLQTVMDVSGAKFALVLLAARCNVLLVAIVRACNPEIMSVNTRTELTSTPQIVLFRHVQIC
jgi:hypothetical protein